MWSAGRPARSHAYSAGRVGGRAGALVGGRAHSDRDNVSHARRKADGSSSLQKTRPARDGHVQGTSGCAVCALCLSVETHSHAVSCTAMQACMLRVALCTCIQ